MLLTPIINNGTLSQPLTTLIPKYTIPKYYPHTKIYHTEIQTDMEMTEITKQDKILIMNIIIIMIPPVMITLYKTGEMMPKSHFKICTRRIPRETYYTPTDTFWATIQHTIDYPFYISHKGLLEVIKIRS